MTYRLENSVDDVALIFELSASDCAASEADLVEFVGLKTSNRLDDQRVIAHPLEKPTNRP